MSREVPEGWKQQMLSELIKLTPGWPFKSNRFTQDPQEGRPLVRIRDLNDQAPVVFTPEECDDRYLISDGDYLIGMDGEFTAVKWSGPAALLNQRVLKIASSDLRLDGNFLFYRIQPELSNIEARTGATTVKHLSTKDILSLQLLLPPLNEQLRIAEILSSVDGAIAATRAVIEQTRKVKQGVLEHLLTKGIGHTRFKQTVIGEIPEAWQIKPLSAFGKIHTGKTPSTSNEAYWDGDIPFLTPGDLRDTSAFVSSWNRSVSDEAARLGRIMPAGAVTVTCIGSTIGKTGILQNPAMTNQQMNTICCTTDASPFVYEVCVSLRSHLQSISGKQAVPIVNKSTFETIMVAYPPFDEQIEISRIALEFHEALAKHEEALRELLSVKSALMSDLLTGRKRVTDTLPIAAE